jgi:hypothetical protein
MVIYLNQHRAANATSDSESKNGIYGDEIMNSNWNPAVAYMSCDAAQRAISPELPDDASAVDVDAFLDKVYALATQI